MDSVAISHDYCHEGGLIYVSRAHSFHLSELSSGSTKIPITNAIILFYHFFTPSPLPPLCFCEVHETGAYGHSFTELTLHYVKRWISTRRWYMAFAITQSTPRINWIFLAVKRHFGCWNVHSEIQILKFAWTCMQTRWGRKRRNSLFKSNLFSRTHTMNE